MHRIERHGWTKRVTLAALMGTMAVGTNGCALAPLFQSIAGVVSSAMALGGSGGSTGTGLGTSGLTGSSSGLFGQGGSGGATNRSSAGNGTQAKSPPAAPAPNPGTPPVPVRKPQTPSTATPGMIQSVSGTVPFGRMGGSGSAGGLPCSKPPFGAPGLCK